MPVIEKERYVKTNVPDLVKDKRSGAILNINNAKLEAYRKQKKSAERVDRLEEDLNSIKAMLLTLLARSA
jgi:hypothetical protein